MGDRILSVDWIDHHARTSPSRIACRDLHSGREYSYAAFDDRIARLANALTTQLDASPGDRILVLSHNDSDVFEIQFACQRTATIFVPLNWRLSSIELEVIARDAGPAVLFYEAAFRDVADQLIAAVPVLRSVEMNGGEDSEYERHLAGRPLRGSHGGRREHDVWALLYTSGTTGTPKGAQITYGMAFCNAVVLGAAFRIDADSRNLVVLPLFHTGGLNVFANPVFFHGGTNIIVREFDPELVVGLMAGNGVTHMLGVPTIHAMLSAQPAFARLDAASLTGLCVAGAPCSVSIIERYAAQGISLRQCWGMTEVGPLGLIMPGAQSANKYGSSGLPSIFARAMLAGPDGAEVPVGEVGELLVKGPAVTSGYWKRPDATRSAFTGSGWFRTGDAAYRDRDGYYYVVDRWKDMFISGGENVYPAEVERVIALLPGVAECAVVAMNDEKWGEVGCAFVVRQPTSGIRAEDLRLHCQRHLARYKIPKVFVFLAALPHTSTGKVLKAKLREASAVQSRGS